MVEGKKTPVSIILNIAPHYREPIFRLMEKEFDCNWVFGENKTDIPSSSKDFMKNVAFLPIIKKMKGFYTLKGWKSHIEYQDAPEIVISLGEIKFIPSWIMMLKNRLKGRSKRKEIILWTHGLYGNEKGLQKYLSRLFFRLADKIIFYGERARKLTLADGYNAQRTFVIHNSLDHGKFLSLRKKLESCSSEIIKDVKNQFKHSELPLLIYIGRLSLHKKIDMLIKALHDLKNQGKNYNLLIVGDGPDRHHILGLTDIMDLEENIKLTGAIYDTEITAPMIYASDACISPGHIGLTAIHSLELGTPVITHDNFNKQAPEVEVIKPGINGELYKFGNSDSLKSSIISVTELSAQDRMKMREQCWASVEDWTPEFQIEVLKKAIEERN